MRATKYKSQRMSSKYFTITVRVARARHGTGHVSTPADRRKAARGIRKSPVSKLKHRVRQSHLQVKAPIGSSRDLETPPSVGNCSLSYSNCAASLRRQGWRGVAGVISSPRPNDSQYASPEEAPTDGSHELPIAIHSEQQKKHSCRRADIWLQTRSLIR